MNTSHLPLLSPRTGPVPALSGHAPEECARLDAWQATVPLLGFLFHTAPASDQGLLRELNRGRAEVRPLSLLDVLDVLGRAGGSCEGSRAHLRVLLGLPAA